jgi:hypothetical protein
VQPGDALADLVFNTLGVVAFSFDGFARLFSNESVQLYYWPDQAVIDVRDSAIFNHGENYMLRTTLGDWTSWKFAFGVGLSYLGLGVSIPLTEGDYLTIGPFLGVSNLPKRDYTPPQRGRISYYNEETDEFFKDSFELETASGIETARIFWDRRGSLMASLEVGYEPGFYLGANLYPGIFELGSFKLGGYAAYSDLYGGTLGVTLSLLSVVPGYRF